MQRRTSEVGDHTPVAIRFAWWVSFLATLAVVFGIALVHSAQALTPPAANPALASALEDEEEFEASEEGEEEGSECEFESGDIDADVEAEIECEEGLEGAGEPEEESGATPAECLLKAADATVAAIPGRNTVRLTVRYSARSAAAVTVDYRLRGGKGSLGFGKDSKRFARSGVYRDTARLSDAQMTRVLAAKTFSVGLRAVNTPGYCHRYLDQELSVRRGKTWSEPAARRGLG